MSPARALIERDPLTGARRYAFTVVLLLLLTRAPGCKRTSSTPPGDTHATALTSEILLQGAFKGTAKPVTGHVLLRRQDTHYELVLSGVQLSATDPVHVYLVGLDDAPSTAAVSRTETKYDFGPLDNKGSEQVIRLPSEPDPALRSVVLWNPQFGINVASAALRSP